MKDKQTLYYSRIERIFDVQAGALFEQFGYKCKLSRDTSQVNMLYDIVTPTLIQDGMQKINKQNLSKYVNYQKLRRGMRNKFILTKEEQVGKVFSQETAAATDDNEREIESSINRKLLKPFICEDVLTDDSMKDIHPEDLHSDVSC